MEVLGRLLGLAAPTAAPLFLHSAQASSARVYPAALQRKAKMKALRAWSFQMDLLDWRRL